MRLGLTSHGVFEPYSDAVKPAKGRGWLRAALPALTGEAWKPSSNQLAMNQDTSLLFSMSLVTPPSIRSANMVRL